MKTKKFVLDILVDSLIIFTLMSLSVHNNSSQLIISLIIIVASVIFIVFSPELYFLSVRKDSEELTEYFNIDSSRFMVFAVKNLPEPVIIPSSLFHRWNGIIIPEEWTGGSEDNKVSDVINNLTSLVESNYPLKSAILSLILTVMIFVLPMFVPKCWVAFLLLVIASALIEYIRSSLFIH